MQQRTNESCCAHARGRNSIETGDRFSRAQIGPVEEITRVDARYRRAEGGNVTPVSFAGKGEGEGGEVSVNPRGLVRGPGECGGTWYIMSKGGGTRFPADHWG